MTTTYLTQYLLMGLLPLALFGYLLGRKKIRTQQDPTARYKTSENLFGWFAVVRMLVPAAVICVGASILDLVFDSFEVPWPMLAATALVLAAGSMWLAVRAINPGLKVRAMIEKTIIRVLLLASLISIMTTIGIVLSIVFEAVHFFRIVNFWDFLTGTTWNPDAATVGPDGKIQPLFGSVPLFAGTFMITAIAMCVAIPVGLFSAICMSEYASLPVRRIAKPALEILAGIPTVVYGFFAAITVSPLVVHLAESVGLRADFTNALSPGLVMGIMIIPFVSSLSDDIINAVPQSLRDGSYGLGATQSETIKRVILPAALPGVMGAILLAASRAIGETMIVVLGAGAAAKLDLNPFEAMTTVTVKIVSQLTGDTEFASPETLVAFALGLTLFVITLGLNVVALYIVRKYREQYE